MKTKQSPGLKLRIESISLGRVWMEEAIIKLMDDKTMEIDPTMRAKAIICQKGGEHCLDMRPAIE